MNTEIKYRRVDGRYIDPMFRGKTLPAPPKWVNEFVNTTSVRYEYASLAPEVADMYPEGMREVCVSYVKSWLENAELGTDLVLSGHPDRVLLWAGMAVMNEIAMRFGHSTHFTASWFNLRRGVPMINDLRGKGSTYVKVRNRMLESKLLVVDGLLSLEDVPDGFWFVNWLYQHRYDNRLPTITTIRTSVERSWDPVVEIVGEDLAGRIKGNAYNYIVG